MGVGVEDPPPRGFDANVARPLRLVSGASTLLLIEARDRFGNRRRSGGDALIAAWDEEGASETKRAHPPPCPPPPPPPTPPPPDVHILDERNGRYALTFGGCRAGCHSLAVKIDGQSVGGSPIEVCIELTLTPPPLPPPLLPPPPDPNPRPPTLTPPPLPTLPPPTPL